MLLTISHFSPLCMLERAAESRGTHPIAGSGMEVSPPHGTYSHQRNHRPPTKFDLSVSCQICLIMSDPERVDRLMASGKFEAAAAMAAQILQKGGQQHPDVAAKLLSRRSEVRVSEPLTALGHPKNPENPGHPREDVSVLSLGGLSLRHAVCLKCIQAEGRR